MHELSDNRDLKAMRELYLKLFKELTNKSDAELNKEFDKELQLDKHSKNKKTIKEKPYDIVDLIRNECNEIVAFNVARIFLPYNKSDFIIHFVPLACCENKVSKEFSRIMTILSIHRTVYLKNAFPNQRILTIFSESSAVNYLQTVRLDKVYPKYNCILPEDMNRVMKLCYQEIIPKQIAWRMFYKANLQYEIKPREEISSQQNIPMLTDSDLHREGFNARMTLEGHETVVAFYATDKNMSKLAKRIDQKLSPGLSFFAIVKKASPLTNAILQPQKINSKL